MSVVAVDTSALIAFTKVKPEAEAVRAVLMRTQERLISAGSVLELGIVLASRTGALTTLNDVIATARLTVCPVEPADAHTAIAAWHRFGRGNHPARLNYGDCFSYALAKRHGISLLAIGEDFSRTDLEVLP